MQSGVQPVLSVAVITGSKAAATETSSESAKDEHPCASVATTEYMVVTSGAALGPSGNQAMV